MSPEKPFQGDTIESLEDLVLQTTGETPSPNIDVLLTDASEFHCFKLIFRVLPPQGPEQGDERVPLEIYLHSTQAIDLFSKLATQLAAYMHQASAELLEIKRREKR